MAATRTSFKPGNLKSPASGRKAGTQNVVNQTFKDLLARVVAEPENEPLLRELRDSDESVDRATYWRLAGKFVPQVIEAHVTGDVILRVVDRSDARKDDDGVA